MKFERKIIKIQKMFGIVYQYHLLHKESGKGFMAELNPIVGPHHITLGAFRCYEKDLKKDIENEIRTNSNI